MASYTPPGTAIKSVTDRPKNPGSEVSLAYATSHPNYLYELPDGPVTVQGTGSGANEIYGRWYSQEDRVFQANRDAGSEYVEPGVTIGYPKGWSERSRALSATAFLNRQQGVQAEDKVKQGSPSQPAPVAAASQAAKDNLVVDGKKKTKKPVPFGVNTLVSAAPNSNGLSTFNKKTATPVDLMGSALGYKTLLGE